MCIQQLFNHGRRLHWRVSLSVRIDRTSPPAMTTLKQIADALCGEEKPSVTDMEALLNSYQKSGHNLDQSIKYSAKGESVGVILVFKGKVAIPEEDAKAANAAAVSLLHFGARIMLCVLSV